MIARERQCQLQRYGCVSTLSFDTTDRSYVIFPNGFGLSKLNWWWSKGGGPYRGRLEDKSFEAVGATSGATVGLADSEDLEGLSLSAVSSTLASFFLFLAILRYDFHFGMVAVLDLSRCPDSEPL